MMWCMWPTQRRDPYDPHNKMCFYNSFIFIHQWSAQQVTGVRARTAVFFLWHALYKFMEGTLTSHGISCAYVHVATSTTSEWLDRRVVSKLDPPWSYFFMVFRLDLKLFFLWPNELFKEIFSKKVQTQSFVSF